MKNFLVLIVIFWALKANAQTYFISFAGTGSTTTVSTVKVENLTAGTTITLNGNDILRLSGDGPVGIPSFMNDQSSDIKIYPNPMDEYSIMQVYTPIAGNAIVTVIDMSGKLLTRINSNFDKGLQEFHLSGLRSGTYFISVKGRTYQYTAKLLCKSNQSGIFKLEKIKNNQVVDDKTLKIDTKGTQATVYMIFTTGDRIKYTATSGNYSTVKIDVPTSDKTITFNFIACTDGDNNNYSIVEIGTQVWMAENLKSTKYRDGSSIQNVIDDWEWADLTAAAYCWYLNDPVSYKTTYGALYNWYAVNTGKLCPTGWHVPIRADLLTLISYLGGDADAPVKLKSTTGWDSGYDNGTNESGFSALPSGYRGGGGWSGVGYGNMGYFSGWWSSTLYDASTVWMFDLDYLVQLGSYFASGESIRCVKD